MSSEAHKIQIIGAMVVVLLLGGIFTTCTKGTNSVKSISTKIQKNVIIKDNNLKDDWYNMQEDLESYFIDALENMKNEECE